MAHLHINTAKNKIDCLLDKMKYNVDLLIISKKVLAIVFQRSSQVLMGLVLWYG